MNVASLELCKELFEISGWDGTHFTYWNNKASADIDKTTLTWGLSNYKDGCWPAYDLGYLLRKLPPRCKVGHSIEHGQYYALGFNIDCRNSSPEDALCTLAIELFKQNILNKGDNVI